MASLKVVFRGHQVSLLIPSISGQAISAVIPEQRGTFCLVTKFFSSIALVMQVCIPILAFGKLESTVSICGGTDAAFAPPVDYITEVTAFYYEKLGLRFDVEILQRFVKEHDYLFGSGYYPQGGGSARLKVYPVDETLSPIDLTDIGTVVRISGYAFVAGKVPLKVIDKKHNLLYKFH